MSDGSVGGVPPLPESDPVVVRSDAGGFGRRMLLVAGLVGAIVGAGAVGAAWALSSSGGSSSGPAFTLRGTLALRGDSGMTNSGGCTGTGGYDDIADGAGVTVYDNGGQVVATGALGAGKPDPSNAALCVFPVTVPGVPGGSKFYKVEVSHRGQIAVSDAEARGGLFAASLG